MTVADEATHIMLVRPELAREIVRQFLRQRRDDPVRRVGLTERQHNALVFIETYAEEHNGLTPSYEEIKDCLGYSSKSRVFELVRALEERGHIIKLRNRARSIQLVEVA